MLPFSGLKKKEQASLPPGGRDRVDCDHESAGETSGDAANDQANFGPS